MADDELATEEADLVCDAFVAAVLEGMAPQAGKTLPSLSPLRASDQPTAGDFDEDAWQRHVPLVVEHVLGGQRSMAHGVIWR